MTTNQKERVRYLLLGRSGEFHHGDCVGSDAEAHDIAKVLGFSIVIHPPENSSKRAFREGNRVLNPLPYLVRNREIVDATDRLIATPRSWEEELRSGTWSTIRYAWMCKRWVIIVWPDGSIGD